MGLVWLIFLSSAINSDRIFSLYEDNEFLLGPIFSATSKILRSGLIPLRLDAILGGFPLYNFTQISVFYPFYGLFLDSFDGFISTLRALHNITLFHLFLMLVNMCYLLRTMGATILAAIAGAVFFTFSADMYSYALWVNITAPYAWLPLYVAGLLGILKGKEIVKNELLALLSICMLIAASPSQPLIQAFCLTGFLTIGYVANNIKAGHGNEVAISLIRLLSIASICALVCAPILIPPVIEAEKLIRWIGNYPAILLNQRIPFEAFVHYKFPIQDFWRIFFYKSGAMVGNPYVGFFAVPLIAFAFLRNISWVLIVLSVVASYALLSSFGDDLGFAYLNHQIPLVNKIREPTRNLALFQFCIAILMALGLSNLNIVYRKGQKLGLKGLGLLLLSAIIISLAFLYGFLRFKEGAYVTNVFGGYQYKLDSTDCILFFVCLGLIVGTALAFIFQLVALKRLVFFFWLVGSVVGLFVTVSWQPPLRLTDSIYVQKNLATLEMAILDIRQRDKHSEYRLIFDGNIDKGQAAMLAAYHGVRSFTYYINPAPIKQAVDFEWHGYNHFFSYQGAGYLICRQCDIGQYPNFNLLNAYGEYKIYRNEAAYPRIYAAPIVGSYSDTKDFIEKVQTNNTSNNRQAYVRSPTSNHIIFKEKKLSDCNIKELSRSYNKYNLLVDCAPGAAIILNEYNDGNWESYINGRPTEILQVNGTQNGVVSVGGTQLITFEYRPKILYRSIYLSVLGVLCFLLFIFVEINCGRKRLR
ncbi:hypothetical protein VC178_01275 [Polynucleobacter sp. AP-Sanab-80-C2]|uniref:hypothetical protein n=1 Tax=Polynucleobacter sp. AP-Sanab-80-C2 TaxID=3108274 RepID=UPI002B23AB40|nr:hypothetical protein [Polynucleobacter sp. AP-Sanab-80-C2]MEA9598524.1 hypothetical protein [Polynucleobacter sp. AP-Sanab-80-C2]